MISDGYKVIKRSTLKLMLIRWRKHISHDSIKIKIFQNRTHNGIVQENKKSARAKFATKITDTVLL